MKLVPISDPVLWIPARQMTRDDREMHANTFKQLQEFMGQLRGAGIALPQIGLGLRAFVSKFDAWPVVINPTWKQVGAGFISKPEGSLSKLGWNTYVRRPDKVYAYWHDVDGFNKSQLLDGIDARVFLHLCDYLDGRPIFPRPSEKSPSAEVKL
jgi:peptide deformylase